jgi:hypothetical protein
MRLMNIGEMLEQWLRRIAREDAAPPPFVTQRKVEQILGVPRRYFLRLARAGSIRNYFVRRRGLEPLSHFWG